MLQRHSSRRNKLDEAVLKQRLDGAASYDRIVDVSVRVCLK